MHISQQTELKAKVNIRRRKKTKKQLLQIRTIVLTYIDTRSQFKGENRNAYVKEKISPVASCFSLEMIKHKINIRRIFGRINAFSVEVKQHKDGTQSFGRFMHFYHK